MHYCILVIGEDYEDQLAQYNEDIPYNQQAKWDWYEKGGRWQDTFTLKDGSHTDEAPKWEIDNISDLDPYAVVKEGIWYERAPWFGDEEKDKENNEKWKKEVQDLLSDVEDDETLIIVDCHY